MSTKWQRINIAVPKNLGPIERQALGIEIVNYIRNRTQNLQVDKNGNPFKGYSKSYTKSLNFKIGGKSKEEVNLTLSGDMLGALDVLSTSSGNIMVGYENGSQENAIADGNIRGTYGQSKPTKKARNFLGLSRLELQNLLDQFEPDQADEIVKSREAAADVNVNTDELTDDDG